MSKKQKKRPPFDSIEEYLEEFEELTNKIRAATSTEGPNWNTESCCLHALSNVFITPREVIVTADLPNVEPETIKVQALDENLIEITAKMKKKVDFKDLGVNHRQGEFSFLRCQGRVDVDIDAENMKISCEAGILEVRFPRKNKVEL
ncbi:MAG: Hsp20/alpha crystallin family protein [Candidatus Bathyarchaeota archaeon]|nr:Hsp20/alpha crystallin family protein [Candidatus Bathyarchaeota archaeon]